MFFAVAICDAESSFPQRVKKIRTRSSRLGVHMQYSHTFSWPTACFIFNFSSHLFTDMLGARPRVSTHVTACVQVPVCVQPCHGTLVEVRRQPHAAGSHLLSSCGLWGSNTGLQIGMPSTLPAEPSPQDQHYHVFLSYF